MTSLYQAFYGVGEHRYFLDLKNPSTAQFRRSDFPRARHDQVGQGAQSVEVQAAELLLPLSVLKGGSGGFLQSIITVTNPMPPEERTKLLDALTRLNDNWIKAIDNYRLPVVTLSDKTEPETRYIAGSFETLNRTGVKVSVFELLSSPFLAAKRRPTRLLRDKARQDQPIIERI